MRDFVRKPLEEKDYKARFKFKLTCGQNIICQRYFQIANYNRKAASSLELLQTLRYCGDMIDKDLKDKTAVYLEYTTPKFFKNEKEMEKYFSVEENRNSMHMGEGIVVRYPDYKNYTWGKDNMPHVAKEVFDKGEYSANLTDNDWQDYKLAFFDNEREVCSIVWSGCYPKYVRYPVDLTNKRGKVNDPSEISKLPIESYILYKMVEGKKDIVWDIISSICEVCTMKDEYYTTSEAIHDKFYDFESVWKDLRVELEKLKKYNESNSR